MVFTHLAVCLVAAASAAWTPTTPLPEAFSGHALVAVGSRLYNIGGLGGFQGAASGDQVWVADANAGSVGAWRPARSLPEPVFFHTAVAANGRIYVLGGYHYDVAGGQLIVSDKVLSAAVDADGSLGPWTSFQTLPEPVFFASAAAWQGTVYVTGGWNGNSLTAAVWAATIQPDGSLGAWRHQPTLPDGVYTHAAVSKGSLYVLGGVVNGGTEVQSAVYYAKIGQNGELQAWKPTTALPGPLSNHGASIANDQILVTGGWNGTQPSASVIAAPVNADGSLQSWAALQALPTLLYLHGQAATESHLFVTGGTDGENSHADVLSIPLPPSPNVPPPPPPQPTDELPPRTSVALGEPSYSDGTTTFVSPQSPITLSAVDDFAQVGDAAGVGVDRTMAAVDDASLSPYSGAIRASNDGAHWLSFLSVDKLGHKENKKSAPFAVDGTAPTAGVDVGAPSATLSDGRVVVSPSTVLRAYASDPVVGGVASGVSSVSAAVDGTAVGTEFSLTGQDGARVVAVQAQDRVGNAGSAQASFQVDGTAPASAAAPAGGWLGSGARVTLSATDALAGVARTELKIDGGEAAVYDGAFGLDEGARSVAFRSVDFVGNAEAWKTAAYSVDLTAPQTTLSLQGRTLFGIDIVSPSTQLSLAASDPVSGGVASGVDKTLVSVDGGAESPYSGPFALASGAHQVAARSIDKAGNAEDARVLTLSVSDFLSDALAAVQSATLSGGASVSGTVRAPDVTLHGHATASSVVRQAPVLSYDVAAAAEAARGSARQLGAVDLSNGQLTLAEGDYYATTLKLSGHAAVVVTGRANLFVAGPIEVGGQAEINASGSSDDLWIVSDGATASLSGNARAALNLYAPNAALSVSGNGQLSGRLLAKTAAISGKGVVPESLAAPIAHQGAGKKSGKASSETGKGNRDKTVASANEGSAAPAPRADGGSTASLGEAPKGGDDAGSGSGSGSSSGSGSTESRKASNRMFAFSIGAKKGMSIVTEKGGSARGGERGAVELPEGAAPAGLAVTVAAAATPDAAKEALGEKAAAGAPVEFGPHGTRFAKPVTIELPFDEYRPDLVAHYWNDVRKEWEPLPSVVDKQAKVVRAQTTHFSLYQVLAPAGPAAGAAAGLQVYAFPNPARSGQTPTVHVEASGVDSVELKVYDVSGELKHQSGFSGARASYDFPVSGLGSGVYVYTIKANGTVRRGRFAVIK